MKLKIVIIGAGIIGITSACRILEILPDSDITIFADQFSPNLTSDISAGYWEPYCLDETSDQLNLILKWAKETYDRMLKVALSEEAFECHVQALSSYKIQEHDQVKIPFWSNIVSQFRILKQDEINSICANQNLNFKGGFHFLSTTVGVSKYIEFLLKSLHKKGVKLLKRRFESLSNALDEIEGYNFDYFINCTGLGSRTFCNDDRMHAIRGQVIRVKAPGIKYCLMTDDSLTYILPLNDLVVLGGTQNRDVYDTKPNDADCNKIIERCSKLIPSLKNAEIVAKQSGLRPYREGDIKLELELVKRLDKKAKVIHNYGHGGSGVTLSWGCASHVVEIIIKDQKSNSKL